MTFSRKCHKKRALFLGTSARVRHDETARNRRCDVKIGRSMPLGTLQDMGKTLTCPFDHRVTHAGHGKSGRRGDSGTKRPLG